MYSKLELETSCVVSFKARNDLARENGIILDLPVDWETQGMFLILFIKLKEIVGSHGGPGGNSSTIASPSCGF